MLSFKEYVEQKNILKEEDEINFEILKSKLENKDSMANDIFGKFIEDLKKGIEKVKSSIPFYAEFKEDDSQSKVNEKNLNYFLHNKKNVDNDQNLIMLAKLLTIYGASANYMGVISKSSNDITGSKSANLYIVNKFKEIKDVIDDESIKPNLDNLVFNNKVGSIKPDLNSCLDSLKSSFDSSTSENENDSENNYKEKESNNSINIGSGYENVKVPSSFASKNEFDSSLQQYQDIINTSADSFIDNINKLKNSAEEDYNMPKVRNSLKNIDRNTEAHKKIAGEHWQNSVEEEMMIKAFKSINESIPIIGKFGNSSKSGHDSTIKSMDNYTEKINNERKNYIKKMNAQFKILNPENRFTYTNKDRANASFILNTMLTKYDSSLKSILYKAKKNSQGRGILGKASEIKSDFSSSINKRAVNKYNSEKEINKRGNIDELSKNIASELSKYLSGNDNNEMNTLLRWRLSNCLLGSAKGHGVRNFNDLKSQSCMFFNTEDVNDKKFYTSSLIGKLSKIPGLGFFSDSNNNSAIDKAISIINSNNGSNTIAWRTNANNFSTIDTQSKIIGNSIENSCKQNGAEKTLGIDLKAQPSDQMIQSILLNTTVPKALSKYIVSQGCAYFNNTYSFKYKNSNQQDQNNQQIQHQDQDDQQIQDQDDQQIQDQDQNDQQTQQQTQSKSNWIQNQMQKIGNKIGNKMQNSKQNSNIKKYSSVVTSAAAGDYVTPQRLYTKALKRKININDKLTEEIINEEGGLNIKLFNNVLQILKAKGYIIDNALKNKIQLKVADGLAYSNNIEELTKRIVLDLTK